MPTGVYKRIKRWKYPHPFSDKHRRKLSISHSIALVGKKKSEEHKKKMSISHKGLQAKEKNPAWKGGKSCEIYPNDWAEDLKDSIRKRDSFVCKLCGIHQDEININFDVHHIDYNKDNLNPDNLITLCKKCHSKTNFDRDYWYNYFQNYF